MVARSVCTVVIGGKKSQDFPMVDMVFQGIVLGLLLWNILFKDAGDILRNGAFQDVIFVDDINGVRFYSCCVNN